MKVLQIGIDYPNRLSAIHPGVEYFTAYLKVAPNGEVDAGPSVRIPPQPFRIRELIEQTGWPGGPDLVMLSTSLFYWYQDKPIFPLDAREVSCPVVLKFTDSHHGHRPITRLVEFARRAGCTHHWTTYNRHHLHFFREAGFPATFWMPGSVNVKEWTPPDVPESEVKPQVLFLGVTSPTLYPHRVRLIESMSRAGLPVEFGRMSYEDSLLAYRQSRVVFNCPPNGDLNRRHFEALMARSFLLTERLPRESGLGVLFEEGKHLECFGSEGELVEKARYYLEHPEKAAAIAEAGHRLFQEHYRSEILMQRLFDHALSGAELPAYCHAPDDSRIAALNAGQTERQVTARMLVYEVLQELHRWNTELTVRISGSLAAEFTDDLKDLPRLKIAETGAKAHLGILPWGELDRDMMQDCEALIFWSPTPRTEWPEPELPRQDFHPLILEEDGGDYAMVFGRRNLSFKLPVPEDVPQKPSLAQRAYAKLPLGLRRAMSKTLVSKVKRVLHLK